MRLIFIVILLCFYASNKQHKINHAQQTKYAPSVNINSITTIYIPPAPKRKTYTYDGYIMREGSWRYHNTLGGTYQCSPHDNGNYNHNGDLVGTNWDISAKKYESFTGKVATKKAMMELDSALAQEIYKQEIWFGDTKCHQMLVHNPAVIDMIYNSVCHGGGIRDFRKALKHTVTKFPKDDFEVCYCMDTLTKKETWAHNATFTESGKYKPTHYSMPITACEIELFNNVCADVEREKVFYTHMYMLRDKLYKRLGGGKSKLKGLLKSIRWLDVPDTAYNKVFILQHK